MGVEWSDEERRQVEEAIQRFPVSSGMCAALARVVSKVGLIRDTQTRGRHVSPARHTAARFVVPKLPHPPLWASHTFVETHAHSVDALTGADGCVAGDYLTSFWEYPDALEVRTVDVDTVDPGIQEDG